ncbi:hypothetical protein [Bacillus sp. UNCCL81]|uniref:TMEM164 family acyltransferase n=1 Tax=Bacillus sp. UNCCL81 TaxID=1502755 RepID=UPI0025700E90|nr:hypothetical protein [Bacillus sp. UNCCL81]
MIGMGFSLIGIALLVGRNIEIYHKVNQVSPEEIPLQIFHFANFILFFAFLYESELLFSIAFCFNLPAALVSIIFANGLSNYQSLLTWQGIAYLWGHMLIVGIVLWAYFNHMVVINLKISRKTMSLIILLYILSIFVNNWFMKWMEPFTSNYFYTMAPKKGTPLAYFYNLGKETTTFGLHYNLMYLLILLLVGLFVVYLFYLVYLFLNLFKNSAVKNMNEQNPMN